MQLYTSLGNKDPWNMDSVLFIYFVLLLCCLFSELAYNLNFYGKKSTEIDQSRSPMQLSSYKRGLGDMRVWFVCVVVLFVFRVGQ